MRGIYRLRKGFHKLIRRITPGAVILMYHRVVEEPEDPYGIIVSPKNFIRHIDYIKNTCSVLPLIDIARRIQTNTLPPRALALTFDDGYIDNYQYARPILEQAALPATFFIPTGYIGAKREFWQNDLLRVFGSTEPLPHNLKLDIREHHMEWDVSTYGKREEARKDLHQKLKNLDYKERIEIVDEILAWGGFCSAVSSKNRTMSDMEIRQLTQNRLFDVGAHTVSHTKLSILTQEKQEFEIISSRQEIEKITGRHVHSFAFPYGTRDDYNQITLEILQDSGFMIACTTIPGYVNRKDDLLQLKRYAVFDWGMRSFTSNLEHFFTW